MDDSLAGWDANRIRRLRRNLRAWSEKPVRNLPWRNVRDPYSVWISEVMLQQTTVATVVEYYRRFIDRFPTVNDLAAAPERDVLLQWEGLGYYSRARNLHKAAQQIVDEHAGRLPDDVDRLQMLSGIGRYTAGAIASLAFGKREPILEANTRRVYARLLGFRGNPRLGRANQLLWNFADKILPRREPGRFNQAMMDLGATLCTPAAPACPSCPLRSCCTAFASGTQEEIPRPFSKPEPIRLFEAAVAVHKGNGYLLRRCREGERWAGLWDFPRISLPATSSAHYKLKAAVAAPSNGHLSAELRKRLETGITTQTGVVVEMERVIAEFRHTVTHHRIRLICCVARYRAGRLNQRPRTVRWVRVNHLGDYPLPQTGRRIATLLKNDLQ